MSDVKFYRAPHPRNCIHPPLAPVEEETDGAAEWNLGGLIDAAPAALCAGKPWKDPAARGVLTARNGGNFLFVFSLYSHFPALSIDFEKNFYYFLYFC